MSTMELSLPKHSWFQHFHAEADQAHWFYQSPVAISNLHFAERPYTEGPKAKEKRIPDWRSASCGALAALDATDLGPLRPLRGAAPIITRGALNTPPRYKRHPCASVSLLSVTSQMPIRRGDPLTVACRLSPACQSELRRRNLPRDSREKKAAYVVALDEATLRRQSGATGGVDVQWAVRQKHLAQSQVARRARVAERSTSSVELLLEPPGEPGATVTVLLQLVVENSLVPTHWLPFGLPLAVTVAC